MVNIRLAMRVPLSVSLYCRNVKYVSSKGNGGGGTFVMDGRFLSVAYAVLVHSAWVLVVREMVHRRVCDLSYWWTIV